MIFVTIEALAVVTPPIRAGKLENGNDPAAEFPSQHF